MKHSWKPSFFTWKLVTISKNFFKFSQKVYFEIFFQFSSRNFRQLIIHESLILGRLLAQSAMQPRPLPGRRQPLQRDKGKSIYICHQQRESAAILVHLVGRVLPQLNDMRVGTLRWPVASTQLPYGAGERQSVEGKLLQPIHLPLLLRPTEHSRAVSHFLCHLHLPRSDSNSRKSQAKPSRYEAFHDVHHSWVHQHLLHPYSSHSVRVEWRRKPRTESDGRNIRYSESNFVHADSAVAGKRLGSDTTGDFVDELGHTNFHLDLLLVAQSRAVCVGHDGDWRHFRHRRIPNVAGISCAYQPLRHHALVPLRASNNDEVRAFHEEARFSASLWRVVPCLVHLPAHHSFNFDASFRFLALQTSAGGHKLGRLSRVLCDDGIALAKPKWPVFAAGWAKHGGRWTWWVQWSAA